ncbi:hypothetical protein CHS0354_006974 [Potamilus streckersoni]|uniref:TGF-beta family profile domain-containing protein n=1 Tax=Potamilus streckersoni TaxID=2493646 RepID=A0AAE0VK79_9BIVA|nr:hypothetical protein CHS0354_006974 [Potamilus streckersoni]
MTQEKSTKEQIPSGIQPEAWKTQHAHRLYFNTLLSHPNDATRELHIHSAKLSLFKMAVRPENLKDNFTVDKAIRVNIYQILSFKSKWDYKRKLIDSKIISVASTGWETFDIKNAVQDWVDSPENNIGIEICSDSQDLNEVLEIATSEPRNRNIFALTNATDLGNSTLPVLRVYTEERSVLKRAKRDEDREDCTIKDGEKKCCRYPIKISFREIGWDNWIIAPADYNGYYCAGSCPYTHKMANTFSAIKALLHLRNPSTVPSPCCYATRLRPFTILHYDENNRYTFSDYPDLIVDQCRCG